MLEKMKRKICEYINEYKSVTEIRERIKNVMGESKKETKEFNELEEKMKKIDMVTKEDIINIAHKVKINIIYMLEGEKQ